MTAFPTRTWRLGELDLTRPYGIRRPDCPPDDDITDLSAWLAGRFDTLAAETFELSEEGAGR